MMKSYSGGSRDWDELIAKFPGAHILQSSEWGDFKSENGWKAERFVWADDRGRIFAAAQILERDQKLLPFGLRIRVLYSPKGPLIDDWKNKKLVLKVISDLSDYSCKRKALFVKIDPDVLYDEDSLIEFRIKEMNRGKQLTQELTKNGWSFSREQIQFRNTVWLDLRKCENDLLSSMKQKTRYNLKLAQKKGVEIRKAEIKDLPVFYDLYAQTADRDGFIIRPKKYYISLWKKLVQSEKAIGLLAVVEGEPVAGLMLFIFAKKAWYFYGMSSEVHRELMPNYLLQWEAMRAAVKSGCEIYDFWGAPDQLDESDPMWGVVRFKLGLGGKIVRTIGAWDHPTNKFAYNIYQQFLPGLLSFSRKIRRRQIKGEASSLD